MVNSPLIAPVRVTGPPVCAVVVTHGVTPFLAATLAALAGQTRTPTRTVVVDVSGGTIQNGITGARADVPGLLAEIFRDRTEVDLVTIASADSLSQAVTRGLAASRAPVTTEWLWLLHDDSAPEPEALARLVRAVEGAPSVAIAGSKQRTWSDPARLLEVGFTTSATGRRMTGVEDGEADQGQFDGREDVLATGTAGALVRRDVWEALRGADDTLGPFGDGLDLSRRARLAGHRVIVVPSAVVRHAQAGYLGLRGLADVPPLEVGARLPDADPTRSFAARRRARLHSRLVGSSLATLLLVSVSVAITGLARFLMQVANKEPRLAVAELAAPVTALGRPLAVARARRRARATARLPRHTLRPLQAGWREVWADVSDRRLARAERRRAERAPSELELAELDALAARRRWTLAGLAVVLVGLTVASLGRLLTGVVSGSALVGDASLRASAGAGDLWRAATSGWVDGALGAYAPGDPFLLALVPGAAILGSAEPVLVALLLGGVLMAGIGAWFAAGAATRSVALRLWAAFVWAVAPALLLAVDQGRAGAVLAHVALPWAALGVARALGIDRRDVVLPGIATARRDLDDGSETNPGGTDGVGVAASADSSAAVLGRHGVAADSALDVEQARAEEGRPAVDLPRSTRTRRGSLTAAAAGGLALALAASGAPVLAVFGLLALIAVAVVAPNGRRRLLLVTAAPVLALFGPTIADAVGRRASGGLRLLLADPGDPVASSGSPAWRQMLGIPVRSDSLGLTGMDGFSWLPAWTADSVPIVLGGMVALLAVLALLRGRSAARAIRAAWLVAACGLAAAFCSARTDVAVSGGTVVRGWPGAGTSLMLAGLLLAALLGADGLRARTAERAFGWRQPAAAVLTLLAVLAPVLPAGAWVARSVQEGTALGLLDHRVVPAVGQQAQASTDRSRVLALAVDAEGTVAWQLLRGDGPQLTERAASVAARALTGGSGHAVPRNPDDVTQSIDAIVAGISGGADQDVSAALGGYAVSDVLVPPSTTGGADDQSAASAAARRTALVARLDATAGLERITENASGVVWRVVGTKDLVTAWARIVAPGTSAGATAAETAVASRSTGISTRVPAGGADRLLVLSERADRGWVATLDGTPLRAVAGDWRQTFDLGAAGGHLSVVYHRADRLPWLVVQGAVGLFVGLLALPLRRRRDVQ